AVMAFDTGPGNMVIDRITMNLFGKEFDQDGTLAAAGAVNQDWLKQLQKESYFAQNPPKTTGREYFGYHYADALCRHGQDRGLSNHDILATATALTAATVAQSYEKFVAPAVRIEKLILGGGGAQNSYLRSLLQEYWPHPVSVFNHEDFGHSTKFKEAL